MQNVEEVKPGVNMVFAGSFPHIFRIAILDVRKLSNISILVLTAIAIVCRNNYFPSAALYLLMARSTGVVGIPSGAKGRLATINLQVWMSVTQLSYIMLSMMRFL